MSRDQLQLNEANDIHMNAEISLKELCIPPASTVPHSVQTGSFSHWGQGVELSRVPSTFCCCCYFLQRVHSYLTHPFILRKEGAPVCVACNAVITVIHISCWMCWFVGDYKEIFRREIFVFTLSGRDSGNNFWFFARDWYVLQNVKCVEVMFVWSVLKELFKFLCGMFYNLFNE